MGSFIDLTGQVFARLKVLDKVVIENKSIHWRCICDCGKESIVSANRLRIGKTRSCGCLQVERRITHGYTGKRIYRIWISMMNRTTCPNNTKFKDYGGRGITVCDEWKRFEKFRDDMEPTYRDGLTLDRKDNNLGYHHSNCRWVTQLVQMSNTRSNRFITFNGETLHISEWERRTGIGKEVIRYRFHKGWTPERIFNTPVALTRPRKNR